MEMKTKAEIEDRGGENGPYGCVNLTTGSRKVRALFKCSDDGAIEIYNDNWGMLAPNEWVQSLIALGDHYPDREVRVGT